jgi:microsomal dipeptidase-like Zn-dependent dipeptidase
LRGIADLHVHQFSNLGFGGAVFWGSTHHKGGIDKALPWCDWTWDFPILPGLSLSPDFHPTLGFKAHGTVVHQSFDCWGDGVGISIGCNSYEGVHATNGTGPFEGWPKWSTATHQQMYYKWLERAYKGGLRLFVQLAVNNQLACLISGKRWLDCADMPNIDRQIDGAYALEAFIDQMSGGPGKGWYRIVTSPAEARQVIEDGKLAVVLGIETDTLFGCKPGTDCAENYIRDEVERYHCKGVRHMYPVHLYDNKYSGAGLYNDFWTIANFFVTGDFMNPWDCSDYPNPGDDTATKYNYKTAWVQGLLAFYEFVYGWTPLPDWGPIDAHCNSTGLTDEGSALVHDLMDFGMVVDVDHLSLWAIEEVLDIAESRSYPLVSGHSFLFDEPTMEFGHYSRTEMHKTAEQIRRIRDLGGVIAPLNPHGKCSSTLDYVRKYRYIVDQMSGGPFYDPDEDIPRIGFSTDFGGFFQQTAPRFPTGDDVCADSKYSSYKYDPLSPWSIYHVVNEDGSAGTLRRPDSYTPLSYPFSAVGGFGTFWKSWTGDRQFDFNSDGLAHVGLLPDFMADLKNVGLTDAELEPMMFSAEAYIRMWEQVNASGGEAVPRVVAEIDGDEGNHEWYISDVTVGWGDHCPPEVIDFDTTGENVSCTAPSACGPVTTSVAIKRDMTPPVVTGSRVVTVEPPSGWFREIVEVEFEAVDATSGLADESPLIETVVVEGEGLEASHEFRDLAGNTTLATHGGINIDWTAPLVGFRFEHAPDLDPDGFAAELAKWHNFDIVFEVFATDELSGVDTVDPEKLVLSTEGVGIFGSATASDEAGNSTTVDSPAVMIDKTPPTITYVSRSPEQPNQHGWYDTPITVTWSCADTLSGVVAAEVTETLSTDGADQSLTGQCVDQAGNVAEETVTGLNLDMTPPEFSCTADPSSMWPPNHKLVGVEVTVVFVDPTSGTDGFWLTAAISNEPDAGLNDEDVPNDVQGFAVGEDDTSGRLRTERWDEGTGRIYTLDYAAQDLAGNGSTCSTTVTVPHDKGGGKDKD